MTKRISLAARALAIGVVAALVLVGTVMLGDPSGGIMLSSTAASSYDLKIVIKTTSDWTDIQIVSGETVANAGYKIIKGKTSDVKMLPGSGEKANYVANINRELFDQSLWEGEFLIILDNIKKDSKIQFLVDKGDLGYTKVDVYDSSGNLLSSLNNIGTSGDGRNAKSLFVDSISIYKMREMAPVQEAQPIFTYILSGGPSPSDPISVDDDLEIKVNEKTVFLDNDRTDTGSSPPWKWKGTPITFEASPGDTIQIIATDGGVAASLSELYLHVDGKSFKLTDGIPSRPSKEVLPDVFFDKSFKIASTSGSEIVTEISSPSDSSESSQLWNSKGIAFSEAGRVQEALNAFDKAIELDPNNANAWENKGYALQNLRRYQEAIDAFDKALELNPDNLNPLVDKTWSLNSLGKRQEAIAVAQEVINKSDKLIAVNPDNDNAWQTKGRGLVFLGKYAEAIIAFDKAISINSINPHNWFNKGEALFTSGKYQEAVDAYDKAISINPNLPYFWRSKGDALKALGKYQEANEAYDKAIEVTTGLSSGVAYGTDNLFLARVITILLFFILIISTVFSQKENSRINLSSYAITGLSMYGILELVTGLLQSELFILVGGLGASAFGLLSKNKRMIASLTLRGFVSFVAGFAIFLLIVGGNPSGAGDIAFPALLVWGCIHGIGVGSIYKNFRKISVVAGVSAFGLLFGALSEGRFADYFGLPSDPPFGYGIFGGILGAAIGIGMNYVSAQREKVEEKSILASDIDIRRGYAVLPNNDIKFGIRVSNTTGYTITDVDTILDYTEELFKLKKSKIQRIGNIPPDTARTAPYILKPLGCIHNENINAIISYTDATGKKHALHMRPKEVHCVCPFLKEKPMSEGEYSRLASGSEFVQEGISFKGISVEELSKFMGETCRHMLYKVKEYDLEGKRVIYLSGESLGEKAYYLLTAVIQDYKGLTQVVLRAHSDKKYGLNGFMNEMADSIRHLVSSVQSAKEIGIIENTQVINIIDSVVQRTSFEMGEGGNNVIVNIKDSLVQRANIRKRQTR